MVVVIVTVGTIRTRKKKIQKTLTNYNDKNEDKDDNANDDDNTAMCNIGTQLSLTNNANTNTNTNNNTSVRLTHQLTTTTATPATTRTKGDSANTHTHTLPHYFYHNTIDFKESEKRRRLPWWYGKFRTKTMITQIIRPRVHSNTVQYKRRYRKMFPSDFDYCTCIHNIKINYNCRQGIIENILNILLFILTSHCCRIMQLLLITF